MRELAARLLLLASLVVTAALPSTVFANPYNCGGCNCCSACDKHCESSGACTESCGGCCG